MAKKHRGSTPADRWLDDEESVRFQKRGATKRSVSRAQGEPIAPELTNAVVVEVFPKLARARLDADQAEILCSYRRAEVWGATSKEGQRERSPVVVGDRVRTVRSSPDAGVIDGVSARRNSICRLAPGRVSGNISHTLASNLDLLVIVASALDPDFSPGLVDRFLIAAQAESLPVVLCITKLDLWRARGAAGPAPWRLYQDLGITVLETCAKSLDGIDGLRARIHGQTAVSCGHSGVGKTSLLNALFAEVRGKTGEVSELGKGKHTTSSAIMLKSSLAGADHWIDTPGVREFALVGIAPARLLDYFPEIQALPEAERASAPRHASYLRVLASLEEMLQNASEAQ